MPVLTIIREKFSQNKPLKGIKLGACLHVTAETANLMLTLKAGGAEVALCASNPLSTQDSVAASLVADFGISTYAVNGEDKRTYYRHLNQVLDIHPEITMDDGADLVSLLHKERKSQLKEVWGSSEETTTGVIRLKSMEKEAALKIPVIAVNDSDTKHLFDNRYGTGQSTIDGIIRATNMLLAGKKFVVCGYGWCGRGLAARARGMGAHVIVTEVDLVKALEAVMDGFTVMEIKKASRVGDIFVTVTGDKNVIDIDDIRIMKDGAVLSNSGHFNVEIALDKLEKIAKSRRRIRPFVDEYLIENKPPTTNNQLITKKIFVLGEGRLINLVAAEGHPADVMDMSFANQALAAVWIVENHAKLKNRVYRLPDKIDKQIAELKLKSMGVKIDKLTPEQKKYLGSWQEGT